MLRIRDYLFIIGAIVLGAVIGIVAVANSTEVRFENCEPYSWVGGVKWEWKDGVRGNYVGSDYINVPEIELKGVGSIVVDLEPGDYAITHFRPPMQAITKDGVPFMMPSAVLDFKEIEVGTKPITVYFGCN